MADRGSDVIKAGLIGENISRSRFSAAVGGLCEQAGIDWDFTLFDTAHMPIFNFDQHIDQLIADGFTGVTVTHPYKTHADKRAENRNGYPANLGASNLLTFGDGITAYNTDYLGMIAAWRSVFGDTKPGRVAVAGAGGVARAIIAALHELGASQIDLWDTKPGAAEALLAQLDPDGDLIRAGSLNDISSANGLVNATPLGMREYPGSAFPTDLIGPQTWVFDAVYTPIETQFMQDAKAAGLQRLSGFDLFKHMAVNSFAAYTGLPAPDASHLNHFANDL